MRPNQQNNKQRSRGRNNNQRRGGGGNPLSRNYESNGPDVKIRGNAAHIAEKYVQLARDATSVGDNVMAENYLQHAEHYFRIILAAQGTYQPRQDQGTDTGPDDEDEMDGEAMPAAANRTSQPSEAVQSEEQEAAEPQREKRQRQRRPRRERLDEGGASPETAPGEAQPAVAALAPEAVAGPQASEAPGTDTPAPKRPRRPRAPAKKAEADDGTVGELPAFLTASREAAAE